MMSIHPFSGARKMKPTQRHRIAIWECMLGTVYAANDEGTWEYFDYDWDAAREFAGIRAERDPRVYRSSHSHPMRGIAVGPRKGQKVLYLLK